MGLFQFMPSYEYACDKCGNHFTVSRPMSAGRVKTPPCPKCHSAETKQVLSAFYAKTIKKS